MQHLCCRKTPQEEAPWQLVIGMVAYLPSPKPSLHKPPKLMLPFVVWGKNLDRAIAWAQPVTFYTQKNLVSGHGKVIHIIRIALRCSKGRKWHTLLTKPIRRPTTPYAAAEAALMRCWEYRDLRWSNLPWLIWCCCSSTSTNLLLSTSGPSPSPKNHTTIRSCKFIPFPFHSAGSYPKLKIMTISKLSSKIWEGI